MDHKFVFKEKIDTTDFMDLYGEKGLDLVDQFILKNSHILKNFEEDNVISRISKELDVNLAKSLFNSFIESKLKDITIKNLKKKLEAQNKEVTALEKIIDDLYKKSIPYKSHMQGLKGKQKQVH